MRIKKNAVKTLLLALVAVMGFGFSKVSVKAIENNELDSLKPIVNIQKIEVYDNEEVTVLRFGNPQGIPIVLLPSLGQVAPIVSYYGLANELLLKGYQVIIYEPLGYGFSDETSRPRTIENIVNELHTTLQAMEIYKSIFMAHSIYGAYTLEYINTYPKEVMAFIGLDSSVPMQINYYDETPDMLAYAEYINYLRATGELEREVFSNPNDYKVIYQNISYNYTERMQELYRRLYVDTIFNSTVVDEITHLNSNMVSMQGLVFPIPVLHFLSEQNLSIPNELLPWRQLHDAVIGVPAKSRTFALSGGHYVYFEHSNTIANATDHWLNTIFDN